MTHLHKKEKNTQGFALVETLVAMLVVSVGITGFIGANVKLSASADEARQRSEAVSLAQQEMERLRLFRSLDSTKTSDIYWGSDADAWSADYSSTDSTSAAESIVIKDSAENTLYTSSSKYKISREITASTVAGYKNVTIHVEWQDRNGNNREIKLRGIINDTDASVAAALGMVPKGSPVKDILGRHIQIPMPAKKLSETKSVYKPTSDAGIAYVFDNHSGEILQVCTLDSALKTAQIAENMLTCTDKKGHILSGYIRFAPASFNKNFDPSTANQPQPTGTTWGVDLRLDNTAPPTNGQGTLQQLTQTYWNGIGHTGYDSPSCAAEYLKTISYMGAVNYTFNNNGSTTTVTQSKFFLSVPANLALTPDAVVPHDGERSAAQISSVTDTGERYVAYSCAIFPIDLDKNATTPKPWTGSPLLLVTGGVIGTEKNQYKVCRFSADYNNNGYIWSPASVPGSNPSVTVTDIDNAEHPYAYLNARQSLSNQNYVVVPGEKNCPNLQGAAGETGDAVEVNGTGNANYTDATTVVHQP